MGGRFLAWYRRYYLLVNLPVLFLVLELVLVAWDPAHTPIDLDVSLARLAAKPPGNEASVLLLGNSGMRMGVDEDQLEAALARPGHPVHVYNFGVASARIDDVTSVAKIVTGRLKPRIAVLGINPFLIDDRINPDSRFPWVTRRSPYLFFHRSLLRGMLKKALRRRVETTEMKSFARAAGVETFLHEFEHRPAADYDMLGQISELVRTLEAQGIPTRVVVLPMSPDGTSRLDTYPALMAALRTQVPPHSLDLGDAYPATLFKDVGHLDDSGRARMTAEIAAWLRDTPELNSP